MAGELGINEELWEAFQAAAKYDRWQKRKEELKQEFLGNTRGAEDVAEKRIEDELKSRNKHDELLTTVATAFHNRSHVTGETGWRIEGIEPLYELDPELRNPDAILGHPDREQIITVECKTGLTNPQNCLQQIHEAAEKVETHKQYLAEKSETAGFDSIELVLLVPGRLANKAVRAIDQEYEDKEPTQPIYLWKYHTFNQEQLQLHSRFSKRPEADSFHNNQLSGVLSKEGVEIKRDPLAIGDFYPESSDFKIMENACFEVAEDRGDDMPTRVFTKQEVKNVIDDPRTMIHYARTKVADHVAENLIEKLFEFDLVHAVDPEEEGYSESASVYRYQGHVEGTTATTLISNLKQQYREEWRNRLAERHSVKKTAKEFMAGQSDLSDIE